jgi:hypothetical protein
MVWKTFKISFSLHTAIIFSKRFIQFHTNLKNLTVLSRKTKSHKWQVRKVCPVPFGKMYRTNVHHNTSTIQTVVSLRKKGQVTINSFFSLWKHSSIIVLEIHAYLPLSDLTMQRSPTLIWTEGTLLSSYQNIFSSVTISWIWSTNSNSNKEMILW